MSRIALLGCTAALLVMSALQAIAAPPAETRRRASAPVATPASRSVPGARPVIRPAAVARQSTPAAGSVVTPIRRVILRPVKTPLTVKPVVKTAANVRQLVTAKPALRTAIRTAAKRQRQAGGLDPKLAAKFDRSSRSSLLPAGSVQLLPRAPQAVVAERTSPARAKPVAAVSAGPVSSAKPATNLPLANLNHPHLKPVARVLPSIPGHKNANRPRLPLFVLAPALLGASWMGREFYVWNRRSYDNVGWLAPIPSCYVGGTVFYRNPWSGECFNFETAEPGERFAVGTKIYTWTPAKYASVEDMVDDQERTGASVLAGPFRMGNPTAPVSRISTEATRPSLSLDATDCSSCLTAIGPVEVTGGQCSVTISNNCGLPVAFDVEFQRNGQTFCQTKLDAASASEVIVCTQPCTAFLESHVNLKSAIPKLATSAPFKGCRPHWAALEEQAR